MYGRTVNGRRVLGDDPALTLRTGPGAAGGNWTTGPVEWRNYGTSMTKQSPRTTRNQDGMLAFYAPSNLRTERTVWRPIWGLGSRSGFWWLFRRRVTIVEPWSH